MQYNEEGSQVYDDATALEQAFDAARAQLLDPSSAPSKAKTASKRAAAEEPPPPPAAKKKKKGAAAAAKQPAAASLAEAPKLARAAPKPRDLHAGSARRSSRGAH